MRFRPPRPARDGSALRSARVKRVWFRLPGELVPAWYVEVQVKDGAWPHGVDYYAYVVSAVDGALLFRHDQTADAAFSYRVYAEPVPPYLPLPGPGGRGGFPHPTGTPDGYQPPMVAPNLVTLESAPFSRNDPWLLPNATMTYGNNVEAHTNMLAPDGFGTPGTDQCNVALPVDGDLHACTSSAQTFDYTYDHALPPDANRRQVAAAVTNLFYMNNYLHDWYYDAGFDEAAGNAQTSNYGRGGIGGDSIFAEAQDYSGTNNANMSTPSDGQRPRMRMFLWSSSIALAKVNAPAAISGAKQAGTADFGPQAFDLTGDLVLAEDAANADGPTTTDGCTAFTNAAAVAGRIAVVDRGVCLFVVKAKNAQNAGAAGVLIVNNVAPGAPGMAGTDATITIPVVSVSLADGAAIKAQLALPAAVSLRIARQGGVQREGSLDNTLIAHEWGHYISNRLVANSNGLSAQQARGMGEGWADFHALLLLVKESDRALPNNAAFSGAYPENAYPLGGPDFAPDALNNAFYYGIRRYPYSRDMAKNPLTFRHIADGVALPATPPTSGKISSANSEVHNTGEVWATMLWECYTNLLNDTGRLTFAQAQERMKRYLVGAYKMTPTDPTFVNARDALLAVMQAQDPADRDLCMQGFAKRGAGAGAIAPNSLSEDNAGVVESFKLDRGHRHDDAGRRVLPRGVRPLLRHQHRRRDREARQRHVRRVDAHRRVVQRVRDGAARQRGRVPVLQHGVRAEELALLHARRGGMRRGQAESGLAVRGGRVRRAAAGCAGRVPGGHDGRLPDVQQRTGRRAEPSLHDEFLDARGDAREGLGPRRLRGARRHHVLAGMSPKGRPKGEYRSAQHEGSPVSPAGRAPAGASGTTGRPDS